VRLNAYRPTPVKDQFRAYWPLWATIALIVLLQGLSLYFGLLP
jgi:hypothetical protein